MVGDRGTWHGSNSRYFQAVNAERVSTTASLASIAVRICHEIARMIRINLCQCLATELPAGVISNVALGAYIMVSFVRTGLAAVGEGPALLHMLLCLDLRHIRRLCCCRGNPTGSLGCSCEDFSCCMAHL